MAQKQSIDDYNFKNRTAEEQREIAKAGGIASGEARRKKKTLAQIGDMIGGLDIKSKKNREILKEAGIADEDMINDVGMMFRLNLKAQQGDTRAIELLTKLRGQFKERMQQEITGEIETINVNVKDFKKNGQSNSLVV